MYPDKDKIIKIQSENEDCLCFRLIESKTVFCLELTMEYYEEDYCHVRSLIHIKSHRQAHSLYKSIVKSGNFRQAENIRKNFELSVFKDIFNRDKIYFVSIQTQADNKTSRYTTTFDKDNLIPLLSMLNYMIDKFRQKQIEDRNKKIFLT